MMNGFSSVPSPGYSLTAISLKGVERGCQGLRLVAVCFHASSRGRW